MGSPDSVNSRTEDGNDRLDASEHKEQSRAARGNNSGRRDSNEARILETPEGIIYGFVKDGVIYLEPSLINPDTAARRSRFTDQTTTSSRKTHAVFPGRFYNLTICHPQNASDHRYDLILLDIWRNFSTETTIWWRNQCIELALSTKWAVWWRNEYIQQNNLPGSGCAEVSKLIHSRTDVAGSIDCLLIRRIAYVCESHLEVFTAEACRSSLI